FDIAGDVEHVGQGVTGFQKKPLSDPSETTYSQASTIAVGFNTAAFGLYAKSPIGLGLNPDLEPGKPTLVIGGSTSVGQYAIQLLRYLGFSTIITYASSHQFTHLKSLGATDLIDRKAVSLSDLPAAVKKITSIPVEVVYDAFGSAESQQAGYDSLADGGQMVIVLPDEIKNKTDGDGKKVLMVKGNAQIEPSREFVKVAFGEKLPRLIEEGIVVPNRVEDLPNGLEGIIDGLKRLKNNEVSGVKLVSHPQETK
ncbi:NAD(P)-binding protein, partial [Dendrothele bispora CBS 962.96]